MVDPIADIRVWDGTAWVPRQLVGVDSNVTKIYPMKVSPDGLSWWPQAEQGETAPSAPNSFTASAVSTSQINLAWTAPGTPGDMAQYQLYRGGSLIYTGEGLAHNDTGLNRGTTYSYNVYGVTPGGVFGPGAGASATTQLGEVNKQVDLTPTSGGSYAGNNNIRTGIGAGPYYSGYYSSTWGNQKSSFHFPIPADVRNCIRINAVWFSMQNSHSYDNGGITQYIAVQHSQTGGSSFVYGSGLFGGRHTPKGGWWGGSEWQDITNLAVPDVGGTVAENFRTKNAWAIQLLAPNNSQSFYSYWKTDPAPRLHLNYTVAG